MSTRLTTIDRVKQRLWSSDIGAGDDYDELIDVLITEVSSQMEYELDRTVAETSYTDYLDGTGTRVLRLRQGPLVTLTSVDCLEYSDDGAGGQVVTPTTVDASKFVVEGLRSEGSVGVGKLRLLSGYWPVGVRNYKTVYTAGWVDDTDEGTNNIPQALVSAATSEVCARFLTRDMHGLISRTVGDGSVDKASIPQQSLDAARARAIAPFALPRVGG